MSGIGWAWIVGVVVTGRRAMDIAWASASGDPGGQVMGAAAEYIDGALAVAVIALFLAIAHHIREAVRRWRLRRIAEQAEEWIASLAAPTPPEAPAGPAGSPTPVGPVGTNERKVTPMKDTDARPGLPDQFPDHLRSAEPRIRAALGPGTVEEIVTLVRSWENETTARARR